MIDERMCIWCAGRIRMRVAPACWVCLRLFERVGISHDELRQIESGMYRLDALQNPSIVLGED